MIKRYKIIMFIVLVLGLVGCGSKQDDSVVTFWTPFTGPDGTYMQTMIDDFNEENEDIEVDMQVAPGGEHYEKLRTAFQSGEGPQVAVVHADQIPTLVQAEILSDMDDFTNNVGMKDTDFIEAAWKSGIYKDTRYTVPLDVHPLVMYVNNDIVEALDLSIPTTYDELITTGKKVVEESDNYGLALSTLWPTDLIFRTALLQNGMDIISEDGTKSNLDDPKALEVAELIDDTWAVHEIGPPNLEVDAGIDLFKQGKTAFIIDGLWMSEGMNEAEINYTIAPLGTLFGDEEAVWANSHQLAILNDLNEEQQENAERFITYVSENSIEWAKGGQVPANISVLESDEFKALEIPYIASQQMDYVKLAPQFDAWLDIFDPLQSNLSNGFLGEVSLAEALEEAAAEGNEKAAETLEQIED